MPQRDRAGSYSLDASAALPRPSDLCVDLRTMMLVKRPAFQQVERLGHATALDAGLLLLPFQLRPLIHHTSSRLHRGRLRQLQHADWLRYRCVTTTSPCYRSLPRLGLAKGILGLDADYATTRPMEKIPHAQPVFHLRMAQRFAGAGSK
jgi:hypothetical protein